MMRSRRTTSPPSRWTTSSTTGPAAGCVRTMTETEAGVLAAAACPGAGSEIAVKTSMISADSMHAGEEWDRLGVAAA